MRAAHCIQVAVGRNGTPQIYLCYPPGVTLFFRDVPRGEEIYFDNEVVPGDTKEVGGTSSKTNISFPGDDTTF